MTPTAKLRWVDRVYGIGVTPMDREGSYVRVLQQWYDDSDDAPENWRDGEWRDIPLEEE
jgi:hypothetical protein